MKYSLYRRYKRRCKTTVILTDAHHNHTALHTPVLQKTSLIGKQKYLVQRVLGLSSPGACTSFHYVRIPISSVGGGVINFQHIRRVDLIARDNARGPVALVQPFVEGVTAGLARRQALFDVRVGDHTQHPGAHVFTIVLRAMRKERN